jgi:hypothetical protein
MESIRGSAEFLSDYFKRYARRFVQSRRRHSRPYLEELSSIGQPEMVGWLTEVL